MSRKPHIAEIQAKKNVDINKNITKKDSNKVLFLKNSSQHVISITPPPDVRYKKGLDKRNGIKANLGLPKF